MDHLVYLSIHALIDHLFAVNESTAELIGHLMAQLAGQSADLFQRLAR